MAPSNPKNARLRRENPLLEPLETPKEIFSGHFGSENRDAVALNAG